MASELVASDPTQIPSADAYHFLFEANPQPMFIVARNSMQFVAANAAAARKYGYSADEFLSMGLVDLQVSEGRSRFREAWTGDSRQPTASLDGEWQHHTREGRILTVELSRTPIPFLGEMEELVVCKDVTARKQIETCLALRSALTRVLSEMPADAYSKVLQGLCTGLGFEMAELWLQGDKRLRLESREVWHLPDFDISDCDAIRGSLTTWLRAAELGGLWNSGYPVWTPEIWSEPDGPKAHPGGIRSALAFAIRASNQCSGVVMLFTRNPNPPDESICELIADISGQVGQLVERRRATEALRASQDRLKLAMETLGVGTWECGFNSDHSDCSEELLHLYGVTDDRKGFTWDEWVGFLHPDDRDRMVREIKESFEKHEAMERDYRVVWPDGSVHWLRSKTRVIFDEDDRPQRIIGLDFDVTGHKLAEDRLRILSSAVEQNPVGILITDLDGRIEYANRKMTEVSGYTSAELKGQNPRILKSGETTETEYRRLWETIQTGEWRGTFHNRKKNGELYWESATILPMRDTAGRPTHYLSLKEDITAQRETEEALRGAESARADELTRRHILFEQSKDGICIFDSGGRTCEVNRSFADMIGFTTEELRGLHVWDWDAQFSREEILGMMGQVSQTPATFETRLRRKGGSPVDVEISSAAAVLGGETFFFAVIRDVSERKAAASALQQSEERVRLIAETISEVVWMADADLTRVYYVSPAYERIWGRSCATLYENPRSFLQGIHPGDEERTRAYLKEHTAREESLDHEFRVVNSDGSVRWIWSRGFPVAGAQGASLRYVGVALDITERKELERQLAQAQKLESIGQLASGIAHEINTPIQYVGDNAKFLDDAFHELVEIAETGAADQTNLSYLRGEVPKALGELREGVDQVARIVRAMKEFSHPGPVEKMPVDINRAIESTILVSRNEWKYVADVTTDLDPDLPPAPCVAGEFNQVILNLIVNAAHAIADVVGNSGAKGLIHISTRGESGLVEIRITDTGTGIPEAIRCKVFDPFFTTKAVGKGTGQGLAIAHAVIVQKHQGTIAFETETGRGTSFVIRLPLVTSEEAA